ncbi:hypothetical protein GQ44DRAFT_606429 [Phaeosphaeriaceae sp. PMI808]|nr:hypothetical protein GQ44DRAFT_606429 [Phaeosphaeriaceae sp. PMI808]
MRRRLQKQQPPEANDGKPKRATSKRQKIIQFFRLRKQKTEGHNEEPAKIPIASKASSPQRPTESTKLTEAANTNDHEKLAPAVETTQAPVPTPSPAPDTKEVEKVETLSEAQLHALFAGAPHFSIYDERGRPTPTVLYPWDGQEPPKDASDSLGLDEPAFSAATLHTSRTKTQSPANEQKKYHGYEVDAVELPSMLSAQGVEPGSIGLRHYLELPKSDSLITDLESSQSSKDFLQATRNKEIMQDSPERIGIRAVDMSLIYDRLIELHDLYDTFHDSPGSMTILNHQSTGDLYANLFSKFLTPPGYDGTADDPTGLRVQILTLVRILKLKGVWYDLSLVEWRIRLGQILWSDPEPVPEHEPHPLWTEREVLFLQITLACELLLRLDAATNAGDAKDQVKISEEEIRSFFGSKTRKLDWDLVLARRFLDNIIVVKSKEHDPPTLKLRSIVATTLGGREEADAHTSDIVLLPQHQGRQLSGLVKFAEALKWPNADTLMQELVQRLGVHDAEKHVGQLSSLGGMFPDPVSPASISVYATPLETPRSTNHPTDSYFGHVGKPVLSRDNSHSLRIPLSPTSNPSDDRPSSPLTSVGGWLSRSYLTGLILPGESISHFLISTLLENDRVAIASLGDSANLYGGFSYAGRTWWSKNSIVGRVFACLDGAVECTGWISFPKSAEGLQDRWHSIHSEQLPSDDRLGDTKRSAAVARDSAIVPNDASASLKSEDLVLPRDLETLPAPSLAFTQWELMPLNPDLIDNDIPSDPTENDIHIPSITFTSQDQALIHTLTLAFDVQFVASWPCSPPTPTPVLSMPLILKRPLTSSVSRTSSKQGGNARMSRRNSHGFEPLLSHPPDSTDIAPKPMYTVDTHNDSDVTITKRRLMNSHPLHSSYKYKIIPVVEVLAQDFVPPFDTYAHKSMARPASSPKSAEGERKEEEVVNDKMAVLVLDARASTDLQLLARAWCAEKGFHAIIAHTERTCLACCIREARGLGIHVVIRL